MKPDWKSAPQDAMFFNDGAYWKVKWLTCTYSKWDESTEKWAVTERIESGDDYENNPAFTAAMNKRFGGVFEYAKDYLERKHGGDK